MAAALLALSLALPSGMARAQIDCSTFPAGPSRTDCYIGVSRGAAIQSEIAADKARVQSDAARYRQIVGTDVPKPARHRQPKTIPHRAPE
jgi:hypothetical protein